MSANSYRGMDQGLIRAYVRAILEAEDKLQEFSTTASIQGYSLPLGMEPTKPPTPKVLKKKRKKKSQ